jgi:hypothetical protein
MSSFKEKIQKNKIKQPTQIGFQLAEWDAFWDKETQRSASDTELYLAGKAVFEILCEIRESLKDLYKLSPKISNEELIRIYVALSNRDREILSKYSKENYKEAKNIFSATINAGPINNELTLQEVADNCVDGIENAIRQCVKRMHDGKELSLSEQPLDILAFATRESQLSQLYGMHESYWQALLWGEYRFIERDKSNRVYAVVQDKTELEVSAAYSHIRKQKLGAQLSAIAGIDEISNHFDNDKYISVSKSGKRQTFPPRNIKNADPALIHLNATWRSQAAFLIDEFPKDILEIGDAHGFSVLNVIDVSRCLVLLAWQLTRKYPQDDGFYGAKKLLQFCPRASKLELAKGTAKVTGLSHQEVIRILEFLEYKAQKGQDLWCHPLIPTKTNEYAILTSALVTPSMIRHVEHWLVQLKLDISEKGESYENTVIQTLNSAVRSNKKINDFDEGVCRRIRLGNGEEEIDLLMRIGNVVLLGEAKSIVTTDSPISQHRALGTLKHAAFQVQRKRKYLIENMEKVFSFLGWTYKSEADYEVLGCVINSGRMFVGTRVDGIPIVDEKVLSAYFNSNKIPLFSKFEKGRSIHLSWFHLYDDFEELKNHLKRYLMSPPQIINDEKGFEHKAIRIPCINNESYKIIFARLIPKDVRPEELLERTHSFPIKSVERIGEELASMDAFV